MATNSSKERVEWPIVHMVLLSNLMFSFFIKLIQAVYAWKKF
jgi:hypothetical protein